MILARRDDPSTGNNWGHLLDQLGIALFLTDKEGKVVDSNKEACNLSGYER